MTFNQEVKRELCRLEGRRDCCEWAQLYAMLFFSRGFPQEEAIFTTESKTVADSFAQRLAERAGTLSLVRTDLRRVRGEAPRCTVCIEDAAQRELLADRFSLQFPALVPAYLERDCCVGAFFRGLFLLYGSVTNPEREYHLELGAPSEELADAVLLLGRARGICFKRTRRKGAVLLYLKESEQIEDFLTLTGATKATLKLMDIKIVKGVRNKVNRATNCETANLGKTVGASQAQVADIQYIKARRGLEYLEEDLRELAALRLDNPECSLRELAELLSEPLSRSGVNHRLRRIAEAAQTLRAMDKKEKDEKR